MRPEKEGHGEEGKEGERERASMHTGRKDVIAGQEWEGGSGKKGGGGREEGLTCQGRKIHNFIHTYLVSTTF